MLDTEQDWSNAVPRRASGLHKRYSQRASASFPFPRKASRDLFGIGVPPRVFAEESGPQSKSPCEIPRTGSLRPPRNAPKGLGPLQRGSQRVPASLLRLAFRSLSGMPPRGVAESDCQRLPSSLGELPETRVQRPLWMWNLEVSGLWEDLRGSKAWGDLRDSGVWEDLRFRRVGDLGEIWGSEESEVWRVLVWERSGVWGDLESICEEFGPGRIWGVGTGRIWDLQGSGIQLGESWVGWLAIECGRSWSLGGSPLGFVGI